MLLCCKSTYLLLAGKTFHLAGGRILTGLLFSSFHSQACFFYQNLFIQKRLKEGAGASMEFLYFVSGKYIWSQSKGKKKKKEAMYLELLF